MRNGAQLRKGSLVGHLIPSPIGKDLEQQDLQVYTSYSTSTGTEHRSDAAPNPNNLVIRGCSCPVISDRESLSPLSHRRVGVIQWLASCTASEGKQINCKIPSVPLLSIRVIFVGDSNNTPAKLRLANSSADLILTRHVVAYTVDCSPANRNQH